MPSSEIYLLFRALQRTFIFHTIWTQATLLTASPLTLWLSLIHMHAQGNAQPHRHIQDRALTTHPLSGTQQGGHVLESEGATSLQQFLRRLSFSGHFSTPSVCVCTACHTQWNQSFNNKCGISWQPRSSDVPIYGAHAWPVRMLCFLLCQMLGLGWGHLFS